MPESGLPGATTRTSPSAEPLLLLFACLVWFLFLVFGPHLAMEGTIWDAEIKPKSTEGKANALSTILLLRPLCLSANCTPLCPHAHTWQRGRKACGGPGMSLHPLGLTFPRYLSQEGTKIREITPLVQKCTQQGRYCLGHPEGFLVPSQPAPAFKSIAPPSLSEEGTEAESPHIPVQSCSHPPSQPTRW